MGEGTRRPISGCDGDGEIESSFERALSLTPLRKWIKSQEGMINQTRSVASKALAAGDHAKSLEALQLAMRMQNELIALAAPKRAVKSKSPTEAESEPDADDNDAPIAQVEPNLSHMSVEELESLAGKPLSNREIATSTNPVPAKRKPPLRRGRPKGHEVSGAAKDAKERADARRASEEREREARANQMRGYDAANTWPMPTIPEEWGDE